MLNSYELRRDDKFEYYANSLVVIWGFYKAIGGICNTLYSKNMVLIPPRFGMP